MRKLTLTLLTLIAIASMAWSQPELYLGGGVAFPVNPSTFKDIYKMGYNGTGGIGFKFAPGLSVIFTASYSSFPIDQSGIITKAGIPAGVSVSVDGGTITALDFAGNIKYSFMPKGTSLYVVASAGYLSMSASDITIKVTSGGNTQTFTEKPNTESAFSTSIGAGVDFPVSAKLGIFVEGRYAIAFTSGESTSYVPVKAGVRIRF
jgi:Outer membrane protein beta-barrel domain